MEHDEDRLSNLPKVILHSILSRLPEEDAAKTSVLSKTWLETWYTFPMLSFSDTQITGLFPPSDIGRMLFPELMDDFVTKIQNFIDYVKRRLLRFYDNGLAIKTFKLVVDNVELYSYMSKDIDIWSTLATEGGVEGIKLYLPYGSELDKEGCRVDTTFMNHSIKFFSLRVLSLWNVLSKDEHAIEQFISCCPLIEHITLRFVDMKSLSMHGLLKLKTVDVEGIQEVYIDAPYLEKLCYIPGHFKAPFKIDFDRCQNLKYLELLFLKSDIITDKWFLELFSNFPFLESLKLNYCKMAERINISSVQLKVLKLYDCSNLKEVNIDAPNLLSCVYCSDGDSEPIISFLTSSSQLKVDMDIPIDYHHLCKLREFVQNIKPQNVLSSLSLFIFQRTDDVPVVFQVSSPPASIEHLHLHCVPENETLFSSTINTLLSICCPAFISLSPHSLCSKAFIEFLYETLMERKGDDCFCSSSDAKCWWHGLKNVKVISSMKIDDNIDFKTMLELLPNREKISFMLEF